MQMGFINTANQEVTGAQYGFINTALKQVTGAQVAFINTAKQHVRGAQLGYINTALQSVSGAQVGFVNFAKRKETGLQLGFINYADTIGKGVPIGFLSIVRKGGYFAVEVGCSEFFPATIGFKAGIEKFYTTLYMAYKPSGKSAKNTFATGFGFGTIIPLQKSFYFNPEIYALNPIERKSDRQITSFAPHFGYNLNKHFSITAGPSVTWSTSFGDDAILKPVFNITNFDINNKNSIFVGARVGIRYRF
jgi:hypothetical protein